MVDCKKLRNLLREAASEPGYFTAHSRSCYCARTVLAVWRVARRENCMEILRNPLRLFFSSVPLLRKRIFPVYRVVLLGFTGGD